MAPEAREVAQVGESRPCRPVCTAGAKAHARDSGEEEAKTRSKEPIRRRGGRGRDEDPEGNSKVPKEEAEGGTKGGGSGTKGGKDPLSKRPPKVG